MLQKKRNLFGELFFKIIVAIGLIYILLSFVYYYLFGPSNNVVAGIEISFSNINKPIRISICFILAGLFIRYLSKKQLRQDKKLVHVLIFLIVFLAYLSSGVQFSPDAKWSIPTAKSILNEFNTDLDEYRNYIETNDYRITYVNGHLYSYFPTGSSIIAAPLVLLFNNDVVISQHQDIELVIASFLMALASLFVYLIGYHSTKSIWHSIIIVFIFSFCTSVWSTASRGLWQHGPSILIHCVILYMLILSREKPHLIQYISLPLAFSFVIRPTNAIPIFLLTIYVLSKGRKYFLKYILWSLPIVIPFFIYNYSIYHSFLSPYYTATRIAHFDSFFEAFIGNLFSPSRGLLIFSPVFLFTFLGIIIKTKEKSSICYYLLLIIALHWLVISSFPKWWGGHCFGPRFFSDMIPYMSFFYPGIFKLFQFSPPYEANINIFVFVFNNY